MQARRDLFDDEDACFFGITVDPADAETGRIGQQLPGIRFFLDYDREVSRRFGAADAEGKAYRPHWLLLDQTLRVAGLYPLDQAEAALDALAALAGAPPAQDWAPVITVPDMLEPELCRRLIDLYEADGGEDSGFMRDVGGKTRLLLDPKHKVRRDYMVEDAGAGAAAEPPADAPAGADDPPRLPVQGDAGRAADRRLLRGRRAAAISARTATTPPAAPPTAASRSPSISTPRIMRAATCASPNSAARTYRAPTGGAVVFSCSLLHEATPVTRGRRFAFLPFLYDEEGASIREENAKFLEGDLANYKAGNDVVVR